MENMFKKLREEGCKGKRANALILEEFQWDNEWIDILEKLKWRIVFFSSSLSKTHRQAWLLSRLVTTCLLVGTPATSCDTLTHNRWH
jgi:hypothetical protein